VEHCGNEEPAKELQQMYAVHLHVLHFLFSSWKCSRQPSDGSGTMAEREAHSKEGTSSATGLDAQGDKEMSV
jgi:hypothetical protein